MQGEFEEGLLTYIHGYGHLPIALKRALEGKDQGTHVSLTLPPVQCFGEAAVTWLKEQHNNFHQSFKNEMGP